MFQVFFIAPDDQLIHTIGERFGQQAHCQLRHPADLLFTESDELYFSNPTLLIVDLQFVSPPLAKRLDEIARNFPETVIVPVAPSENRIAAEGLIAWGAEEVMIWPRNGACEPEVREGLLRRFAALERIVILQDKLRRQMGECRIVAKSKPLRELMQQLPSIAEAISTVLITGETGSGKELVARAIHYLGPRAGQPFVTVDCGAIPEHLIENELFGHARGAYTNADASAKGLIAEAEGGTLLLDEVEALPLAVQSKFLRFLQEHQFKPLGQTKYVQSNVRVIAATNIELAHAVEKRAFRSDLYYRLNVVPLYLPPLRRRKADLPGLVKHFLQKYAPASVPVPMLPDEVLKSWLAHDWPGNVRELENKVQAWLVRQSCEEKAEDIFFTPETAPQLRPLAAVRKDAMAQCERSYLHTLLLHTRGNISAAARLAEMHRKNLAALLKKYGFRMDDFRH